MNKFIFKNISVKKLLCASLCFSALFLFADDVKHAVQKGETYYSISKKYGLTVDELCKLNNLTTDCVLKAGQVLIVKKDSEVKQEKKESVSGGVKTSNEIKPATETKSDTRKYDTYTVQKGDTFYRISKVNGITVDELKKLNNLENDTVLKLGQKLKIPVTLVDTKNTSLPDLPSNDPRNYSTKKVDSSVVWPVKNPEVTYMKGKVSGVRLSASKDETVKAIRAGTVMYVGNYRGYGQVVFVQSKTGHMYTYSGLGSIKVKKGDYIVFGDVIGTAGVDSITNANCITLMVFQKSTPIDPVKAPRG